MQAGKIPHLLISVRTAIFAVLIVFFSCKRNAPSHSSSSVLRIISCAPSITETLFALGLGENVVGVTSYCMYPPEAKEIEKIGGYTDINLEKVLSLKPDVVVLQQEHKKQHDFFIQYGITVITVDNKTCSSICSSFIKIGYGCAVKKAADSLVDLFHTSFRKESKTGLSPKVMLCVGRDAPGGGVVRSAFIVGKATFYNDIIEAAGGINAFADSFPHYPKVSTEGIIALNPDIIIDLASSMSSYTCSELEEDWKDLQMLTAVKTGNVYCVTKDYATVPGPRILQLLQDFRTLIKSSEGGGS